MDLKRGDLVIVSAPGSYGKPRPGVVIQSDQFSGTGSLTVLLMTSELMESAPLLRHTVSPAQSNGLLFPSDVMIDKLFTIPRERMKQKIGSLSSIEMTEITAAVALFLGL